MQTHKNPNLRASSQVNANPKPYAAPKAEKAKSTSKFAAPKKDPVFELDGKKWMVRSVQKPWLGLIRKLSNCLWIGSRQQGSKFAVRTGAVLGAVRSAPHQHRKNQFFRAPAPHQHRQIQIPGAPAPNQHRYYFLSAPQCTNIFETTPLIFSRIAQCFERERKHCLKFRL